MSSFAILNAYYSIAATHYGGKFNVLVQEAIDKTPITKSSHSWEREGDIDLRQAIRDLSGTCLEIGELQMQAQEDFPVGYLYSLPILVSLHDTPEELLDEEIISVRPELADRLPCSGLTVEQKGNLLVYSQIMEEISNGATEFPFVINKGSYILPDMPDTGLEEAIRIAYESYTNGPEPLKNLALTTLKLYVDSVVNDIAGVVKPGGREKLLFIGLQDPAAEYLRHPDLMEYMRQELLKKGINLSEIDLKFPSDDRGEYYENVMRPHMGSEIMKHLNMIEILNDPIKRPFHDMLLNLRARFGNLGSEDLTEFS